ncbi:MAG: nuclear transport factor 2 family protein [Bacteroidota bacterium]|nr:nuclear transport factor 2 family protein [Bacteroidota bacterium]
MKKIIVLSIFLSTFYSCNDSIKYGYVSIDDEKSKMIQELFNKVSEEDIEYIENIFSDEMTLVNSNGEELNKSEFIAGVKDMFDSFENITFDEVNGDANDSETETNYYSNGLVWTAIWNNFTAKGKYTREEVSFPFHISYLWEGDKIIKEVQYFNPDVFENERNAKLETQLEE